MNARDDQQRRDEQLQAQYSDEIADLRQQLSDLRVIAEADAKSVVRLTEERDRALDAAEYARKGCVVHGETIQGLSNQLAALRAENEKLRELVKGSYAEGYDDGWWDRGHVTPNHAHRTRWASSQSRKVLADQASDEPAENPPAPLDDPRVRRLAEAIKYSPLRHHKPGLNEVTGVHWSPCSYIEFGDTSCDCGALDIIEALAALTATPDPETET